ncbi:MAG: DNA-3-methyladenine glycosylase [Acidimicrobiales bacterium]
MTWASRRADDETHTRLGFRQIRREPYGRSFFEQPVDVVARELIGSHMRVRVEDEVLDARIIETEAYGGMDDPASHAFRGPTPRSAVMFGPAGYLYVYRSYGIHWCMNVVTQEVGTASAVLLRAAQILGTGETTGVAQAVVCRGPGNLTRALGITGVDNGVDCCDPTGKVSFIRSANEVERGEIAQSARVGVSRARERQWRYFLGGK